MDKQKEDGIEKPIRPSGAEQGMFKTLIKHGVTPEQYGQIIDVSFSEAKFSVNYHLKHLATLLSKIKPTRKSSGTPVYFCSCGYESKKAMKDCKECGKILSVKYQEAN